MVLGQLPKCIASQVGLSTNGGVLTGGCLFKCRSPQLWAAHKNQVANYIHPSPGCSLMACVGVGMFEQVRFYQPRFVGF